MNKRGILSPIDIIAGIIVVAGGIMIAMSYVNLGTLVTTLGLLIEIIKVLMKGGLK